MIVISFSAKIRTESNDEIEFLMFTYNLAKHSLFLVHKLNEKEVTETCTLCPAVNTGQSVDNYRSNSRTKRMQ